MFIGLILLISCRGGEWNEQKKDSWLIFKVLVLGKKTWIWNEQKQTKRFLYVRKAEKTIEFWKVKSSDMVVASVSLILWSLSSEKSKYVSLQENFLTHFLRIEEIFYSSAYVFWIFARLCLLPALRQRSSWVRLHEQMARIHADNYAEGPEDVARTGKNVLIGFGRKNAATASFQSKVRKYSTFHSLFHSHRPIFLWTIVLLQTKSSAFHFLKS